MEACPSANILALLADGSIDAGERTRVEHHLDACIACTQVLTELAWVIAPPRSAPPRFRIVRASGDRWIADDVEHGGQVVLQFAARRSDRRPALMRHATALAALHRPAFVPIEHVATHDDEIVIASALTSDDTARTWRASEPSQAAIIALWRTVILEVSAIHHAGIVHGGLSPDHVLVDAAGTPRIGGFGAIPAPAYRSVEVLHGAEPSRASDQFALCVALWEALAGKPPFSGATVGALAVAITVPIELPDDPIYRSLARGLDPDPTKRWPDLRALVVAIDRPAPPARRWILVIAAVAVVAGVISVIAAVL